MPKSMKHTSRVYLASGPEKSATFCSQRMCKRCATRPPKVLGSWRPIADGEPSSLRCGEVASAAKWRTCQNSRVLQNSTHIKVQFDSYAVFCWVLAFVDDENFPEDGERLVVPPLGQKEFGRLGEKGVQSDCDQEAGHAAREHKEAPASENQVWVRNPRHLQRDQNPRQPCQ